VVSVIGYRIEMSWVRIPVSLGVMGSDGICKYLSCLTLLLYAWVLCFGLY